MKKVLILITVLIIIFQKEIYSQPFNSPYPVIFVHGLNSDDQTWNTTLTQLSASWILSSNHTLNAVLNARGGDTTDYFQDVLILQKDANGNFINRITASSVYSVNFGNFWNRNNSDPRIILYNNNTPGSSQSPSNQSAIFKQAFVLKILIDSVLRVTGASKVILAGHSMGGLAIREYLQRKENGIPKWWIDPDDPVSGHKVAKVVTIGTPHLGTNVTSVPFTTIDINSEAMRDMRISYSNGFAAAYLFTNSESAVPTSYYNTDINCNGSLNDSVKGISYLSGDNPLMPLPQNISYTWIVSNYLGLGTDLAVSVSKQSLYNDAGFLPAGITDTLMTNKNHIQETSDAKSLIRGLDEPDKKETAYDVASGKTYSGFITSQKNGITSDSDFYKIQNLTGGKISLILKSVNAGVTNIALISENGSALVAKNISSSPDSISFYASAGNYFIRITGNSNQNVNFNSYSFTPVVISASELNLKLAIEGFWDGLTQTQDSVRIYLRNSTSPYTKADSSVAYLNSSGEANLKFIHIPGGNYYLQIIHRNSVETWSSSYINFSNESAVNYDFTDIQSRAYGNNLVLKAGRYCIYGGDINHDGAVDASDVSSVDNDATNSLSGYVVTDLTGDDFVDAQDVSIVDNNAYNSVNSVTP
jgi:pimeloyl-ACP methyl ester carboxylesterase